MKYRHCSNCCTEDTEKKDDLYLHISVALRSARQLVRIHTHTKSGNDFPGVGTEVINNKVSFIL